MPRTILNTTSNTPFWKVRFACAVFATAVYACATVSSAVHAQETAQKAPLEEREPYLTSEPVETSPAENSGRSTSDDNSELDPDEDSINWVDTSHAFATDQAQALTEWMDEFFGDPNYELEKAESQVRLQWRNSWDQQDNYNTKLRLGGKLQLPKISQRLNLVFSGEDGDVVTDDRADDNSAGLLYNVNDKSRQRLDLTLNLNSSGLRPGVRYRNKGPISDDYYYRYTQRLEWENDEGFYTTSQLNLDYALSQWRLVRLSNRIIYGEETLGAEWRSILSHSRRRPSEHGDQRVVSYFAAIEGFSDPTLIESYRAGMVFRRQVYRKFMFVELEPSYIFRKRIEDDNRDGVWSIRLRFEVFLTRDLRSTTSSVSRR